MISNFRISIKRIDIKYCIIVIFFLFNTLNIKKVNAQTIGGVSMQEYFALVDLYNSTNGSQWINKTNWLTGAPVSTWYGVTVIGSSVNFINLQANNLKGYIPNSITNLIFTSTLILSQNKLSGTIPIGIKSMPANLIDISMNDYTYQGLEPLFPTGNKIMNNGQNTMSITQSQYSFPLKFNAGGTLSNTTYKWYKNDTLIATNVADSTLTISDATAGYTYRVEVFNSLNANFKLTANNNVFLARRDSLALVDLYNSTQGWNWTNKTNWLTSSPLNTWYGITMDGANKKRVMQVKLDGNNLGGSLPSTMSDLSYLYEFSAKNNKITGVLPSTIGRMHLLWSLRLEDNQITGSLPSSMGDLSELYQCSIANNKLTGEIPSSIGGLKKLYVFYLYNNQLSGVVPASFINLTSGVNIRLEQNLYNFTGFEKTLLINMSVSPQSNIPVLQSYAKLLAVAGGTLSNNTYYWYRNGVLTATIAGDSIFIPTVFGKYSVTVSNAILGNKLTLYSDTILINSLPTVLCGPTANTNLTASISGVNYQWQLSTNDSTFTDISNGLLYSGVNTNQLQLISIPSSYNRYKYRCLVDDISDGTYTIQFRNNWLTTPITQEWGNVDNWSCGIVPDENSDVFISSGNVIVTQDAVCRSLTVSPNATVTVNPGITLTVTH